MSDKRALYEAQILSLREIIKTLETAHPDEIAKKWRVKVFEEMMRNKQLQIANNQEIRRIVDENRRLVVKNEDLIVTLQKFQASISQFKQENEILSQRLASEKHEKSILLSIQKQQNALLLSTPQHLQHQFETMTEIQSKLDHYQQRISAFQMQIKAVKRVNDREKNANFRKMREILRENEELKMQTKLVISMNLEMEMMRKEVENWKSRWEEKNKEKLEIEAEFRGKISEKEEILRETVEKSEQKQKLFEAEIEKIKTENAEFQAEIHRLKSLLLSSEDSISSKTLEIAKFQELLSTQKSSFETEFARLSSDLNHRIDFEREKHQGELETLRLELSQKEGESSALIERLESDIEELRLETLSLKRDNKDLKRERSLLVTSLKTTGERKVAPQMQVKAVQTNAEPDRGSSVRTLKSKYEEIQALGSFLLDTP